MEKPWKVIAAFIGVFIAGAVFGGFFSMSGRNRAQANRPPVQLPPTEQPRTKVAGPQLPAVNPPPAARPNQITPQLMRQFTKQLKLTPEQREKMQPIVGRAGEDFQRLREEESRRREEHTADVARVNERMYADVSGLLTPEQREELQAMRQRIEEKFQEDRRKRAEAAAAIAAEAQNRAKAERPALKQGPDNSK
jgi:Spy/CpxP family protein refolding chaperone